MLSKIFNRFKNRQMLKPFECRDGNNTGYSLTLEIMTLKEYNPGNEVPGYEIALKELPWARISMVTREDLVGAHMVAKDIEVNTYNRTGKAFDVFVKPEGSQNYYGGNNLLLGLAAGRHQVLLLPKGSLPKDGIRTMTPKEPLREAFDVPKSKGPA